MNHLLSDFENLRPRRGPTRAHFGARIVEGGQAGEPLFAEGLDNAWIKGSWWVPATAARADGC